MKDKNSIVRLFHNQLAAFLMNLKQILIVLVPAPWYLRLETSFAFRQISVENTCTGRKATDAKKNSPGPDDLKPFLLKITAKAIAELIASFFSLQFTD